MQLARAEKLLQIWRYSLDRGTNVILMRHAPKAGSNESDLSAEGVALTKSYSCILDSIWPDLRAARFLCTSKSRTSHTLRELFPRALGNFEILSDLDANTITSEIEKRGPQLHTEVGRWRGLTVSQTYYFLTDWQEFDWRLDLHGESLGEVAQRMTEVILSLADCKLTIYCGHSPQIEVACEKLLDVSLLELGGFLNPLDSLHLKITSETKELVARVNPIVGYVDLESETYFT